jgi:protocatechuate 3,4-dioxygenase beta subunit
MRSRMVIVGVVACAAVLAGSRGVAGRAKPLQERTRGSGVVSGLVVLDQRPAKGVTVTLGAAESAGLEAVTDERGVYSITGVPPGTYLVRPKVPGYCIVGEVEYQLLTLEGHEPPQRINFSLTLAGSIGGRVTDSGGAPVPDARVFLYKVTLEDRVIPGRAIPSVKTGGDGRYQFTEVQPGRYQVVVRPHFDPMQPIEQRPPSSEDQYYHPSGSRPSAAHVLLVETGQDLSDIDIRCGPELAGLTAAGRVIDTESASAVSDMGLLFGEIDTRGVATVEQSTNLRADAQGRFTISGLKPGSYWVAAHNRKPGPHWGRPVRFDVTTSSVKGLEVPVSLGVALAGTVVFEPPEPSDFRSRLTVLFRPAEVAAGVASNNDFLRGLFQKSADVGNGGRFVLEGLPPGPGSILLGMAGSRYAFRVEQGGVASERGAVVVHPGGPELRIIVSAGSGVIRGLVRFAAPGLQTNRYQVSALRTSEPSVPYASQATINPDGRFVLDGLPPGDYAVMVAYTAAGGSKSRMGPATNVHLEAGGSASVVIDLTAK